MITTNENKKTLVDKLLSDKTITIAQAYMLLDEPEVTREYIPYPISQPYGTWPNLPGIGWPGYPIVTYGTTTISTALSGTLTNITTADYLCTGGVTDTTILGDIDAMLRSGQLSYTSN